MRRRGIEPRPIAWKAIMLTTTPTPLFSGNQDASHLVVDRSKFAIVYGDGGKPSSNAKHVYACCLPVQHSQTMHINIATCVMHT